MERIHPWKLGHHLQDILHFLQIQSIGDAVKPWHQPTVIWN
jgi:hypothetical protein